MKCELYLIKSGMKYKLYLIAAYRHFRKLNLPIESAKFRAWIEVREWYGVEYKPKGLK